MFENLAINGGIPVRRVFLPYGKQWIDENDVKAISKIATEDCITQGPKINEFEKRLAEYCGAKYGVAMANGTAALHAACSVAGVTKGTEAITTPITFAADANAVIYNNGKPIFADIDPDTLNIDSDRIKESINEKTRAIIPVDFTGLPCDLDKINKIARENDLIVIEDAAHALGARYKGQKIGSISDMTVFSFHPVKHITTGEGGMVLTNNETFYEKLKTFRHHGIIKDKEKQINPEGPWYYEIQTLGHNFRITDFQCVLGISQMNKLDYFVKRRREIASQYTDKFKKMPEIIIKEEPEGYESAYHIYVIQLNLSKLKTNRKKIFEALRAENIGVHVHYVPVHYHPFYKKTYGYKKGDYPNAEEYYERALTLPVFPKMSDEDVKDVVEAVRKVICYYRK